MPTPQQLALIQQQSAARGLDPQAVLAVSGMEGLSGGIGDGGHAFGPWQLNNAGGVLTGQRSGTPQQLNDWAWTPQGINYALDRIAKVAKGLTGRQAVDAIVNQFERPANPQAEIAGAYARLGRAAPPQTNPVSLGGQSPTDHPSWSTPATHAAAPSPDNHVRALLSALRANGADSTVVNLLSKRLMQPAPVAPEVIPGAPVGPTPVADPGVEPTSGAPTGHLPFSGVSTEGLQSPFLTNLTAAASAVGATQIRLTSGYRSPEHNQAIGGVSNSNHLTGNAVDGYALIKGDWVPLGVALQTVASKFGLRSGNVPGFYHGGLDPVHVDSGANQH